MSEQLFNCPACAQKIACDSSAVGTTITCPSCHAVFPVAPPPKSTAGPRATRSAELQTLFAAAKQNPAYGVAQVGKNYCGFAMASLLCSVVLVVGWLPGIICGHLARARIRRDPLLDGERMALAGLVISYLSLVAIILSVGGFVWLNHRWSPAIIVRNTPAAQVDLERRIVDEVKIADAASEAEHAFQGRFSWTQRSTGTDGTNRWRGAQYNDLFAYVMKVLPDQPMILNCRYSDSPNQRSFDVTVNEQVVGGEMFNFNVPGHFFDVEYKIPESVTKGQTQVTVQFRSQQVMLLSKLYGCQMLKRQ